MFIFKKILICSAHIYNIAITLQPKVQHQPQLLPQLAVKALPDPKAQLRTQEVLVWGQLLTQQSKVQFLPQTTLWSWTLISPQPREGRFPGL